VDPKNPINELTNKGKKSRNKKAIPDAIFRSRSAKISIDLATTGLVRDVPKASVIVLSKSGNITLNLLPAEEARPRFDLEIKSNSGTCYHQLHPAHLNNRHTRKQAELLSSYLKPMVEPFNFIRDLGLSSSSRP
jgi:hypothetical protein